MINNQFNNCNNVHVHITVTQEVQPAEQESKQESMLVILLLFVLNAVGFVLITSIKIVLLLGRIVFRLLIAYSEKREPIEAKIVEGLEGAKPLLLQQQNGSVYLNTGHNENDKQADNAHRDYTSV